MTSDLTSDEVRPRSWADAFPWLAGASGIGAADWWTEPIEGADPTTRRSRLAAVSTLAMERLTRWTIGDIFPGLPADIDVTGLDLPVRACNVLGKYGRSKPGRLQGTTLHEMLDWYQMGAGTADAILQALADVSTSTATPAIRASAQTPLGADAASAALSNPPGWVNSLVEDLTNIATWYSTIGSVDQPLIGGASQPGMPDEIVKARQRVEALRVSDLLSEQETERDIAALFDDALSVLDARASEVLEARLFADDPPTLDQLGQKYNVTRERIRQIEGKARGTMMTVISEEGPLAMAAQSTRDLIGTIRSLDDLLEMIPALAKEVERVRQPAWRVLDRLDDAYEIEDGWCVVPTMSTAMEFTRTQLAERANQYGVIRLDELELVESRYPDQAPAVTASWLTHCGFVVSGEYVLTRTSSVGDYAAAVLFLEGSPLSSQEIVDRFVVDRSARSLGNSLSADERFDRVDRDRWALKEWEIEAYTGIRSLIRELVARGGGRARLDDVVEHITGRYSVSASSVIAYSAAAPFTTKDGIVQLGGERTVRKPPRQTRRLFRRPDAWVYRVRITTDHLRGSGSVAPMAITTILGLNEGQTKQLESPLGPQAIAWTGIQPQFGTIRRFLMDGDVAAGTEAFLVIHDNERFSFEQAPEMMEDDSLAAALTLVGARPTTNPVEARAALANAIELPEDAPVSSIIGDYRARGDDDVADLLLTVREQLETGEAQAPRSHNADVDEILGLL
ncbi:RNA polymerase factor sigma-32 [Mycobacteroides abscessus subsp. bolletii]|uniref:sigma factor-like helix-turn-helix DNA-binding protein n=1 Tax=Mycobacteroides abscessus TaxID=36809 RepID=UPI00092C25AB|nr:sigma factor-like helix-turn-helix DNA-binding protein [Mycobacteroides abscessus]SIJ89622.1 RNA polymerase factor sigma-32 [Mycobacteroides abscessus subsp. bolletii]SLF81199.1 RNA polymerase factor sigma-32 [Mycobacteroides abscessus subsp. bolletii]